jgi:hypothetical protein
MFITPENIQDLTDAAIDLGAAAGIEEFVIEQTRRELAKTVEQ